MTEKAEDVAKNKSQWNRRRFILAICGDCQACY